MRHLTGHWCRCYGVLNARVILGAGRCVTVVGVY